MAGEIVPWSDRDVREQLPDCGPGRYSAFELPFVPQLQAAGSQRLGGVFAHPETDAGDKSEAVSARSEIRDDIRQIRHGRPICARRYVILWCAQFLAAGRDVKNIPNATARLSWVLGRHQKLQ
jgi:hypothetical protein